MTKSPGFVAGDGFEGEPMRDLSLTVKGVTIGDTWLRMVLSALPDRGFGRNEALAQMESHPWPGLELPEGLRPVLQHLKRRGMVSYDAKQKLWHKVGGPIENDLATLPIEPLIRSSIPLPKTAPKSKWRDLEKIAAASLPRLVSLMLVFALMAINAGFAWNLTEDAVFRVAFTVGFMALDGLRPILMAHALGTWGNLSGWARSMALIVALGLSPASIISSTTVVSSALILGTETHSTAEVAQSLVTSLQKELERLEFRASQSWEAYEAECSRGGCGDLAEGWRNEALATEARIADTRNRLNDLSQNTPSSSFASRTVGTLQAFGVNEERLRWLMPIFLALTLEIAALFGPALVLGTHHRP